MMNSIFQELLHEEVLVNYMNDFVISTRIRKKLKERMIHFLKVIKKHNICFKRLKYNFNAEEIPILGIVVGRGKVQMENNKIKVVKEWKTPTKIKEVESFLEFTNFYQCFIKNFSHMVKFLNKLKRK